MAKDKDQGHTVSTKISRELLLEFEAALLNNGHTKASVFRVAVIEYIKRYAEDEQMRNYAENIQFE